MNEKNHDFAAKLPAKMRNLPAKKICLSFLSFHCPFIHITNTLFLHLSLLLLLYFIYYNGFKSICCCLCFWAWCLLLFLFNFYIISFSILCILPSSFFVFCFFMSPSFDLSWYLINIYWYNVIDYLMIDFIEKMGCKIFRSYSTYVCWWFLLCIFYLCKVVESKIDLFLFLT